MRRLVGILASMVAGLGAHAGMPAGAWDGWLAQGESRWPMSVVIDREGGALLDIDRMGMFRVPASFEDGDPATLEFPFGLGAFELEAAGPGIVEGRRDFGGGLVFEARFERAGDDPGYTTEEVRFEGDGVTLAASLYVPRDAAEPVPGVVMVHGSAIGNRSIWESHRWVKALLDAGVGVLVYDRRGEGASDAGEPDVLFEALSADALVGLRTLADDPRIDAERVGLMGGSQGGWIAVRAAAISDLVSFLILTSSPAVSPAEQDRQQLEATMRAADASDAHLAAALAYHDLYFQSVRGEVPFEALAAAALEAQELPWGSFVDQPQTAEQLDWWRTHHDFDMVAALAGVRVPVLALWGERDSVVPAKENTGPFEEALPEGARARLVVCPDADHALECPGFERDDDGRWVWPGLSSVAFDEIARFCRDEVRGG